MQRRNDLPVKGLNPTARPVDMYYRPQERDIAKPDMSGADQLVELGKVLGVVHDKAGGFFDREKKVQDAEAGAKGARLALDNNKLGWNAYLDHIKENAPEKYQQLQGANPWVQRGYEEQHLKNLGLDYADQLDIDMTSNPVVGRKADGSDLHLHDAEDPGAVSLYMAQHLQTYMKAKGLETADDIALVENFLPSARESQVSWMRRNAAERRDAMVDKRLSSMATNSSLHLTKAFREGVFTHNSADAVATLGATLTTNIREAYDGGVRDFDKLNDKTVEAVVSAAKLYKDPRFLQVLDHVETSPGNKLGGIPKYQLVAEQTRQYLQALDEEKEKLAEWRKDKAKKAMAENVMSPVVMRMISAIKDPNVSIDDLDVTPEVEKLTRAGMGQEAMALMGWRQSLINQETNVKTNMDEYGAAQERLQKGELTITDIVKGTGKFWSDDVAKKLIADQQFYQRIRDDKEEGVYRAVDSVMDDDTKFIKEAIGGTADFSANTPKDVRNRALEAVGRYRSDLQSMIMDHASKNNGAFPKPHEIRNMASKLRQEIINDPLYRSANSNNDRFLSPDEQKAAKQAVPNAQAGDYDVFRKSPEDFRKELDKVVITGLATNEQELENAVKQFETTGTGMIAALAALHGVPAKEIIAKQVMAIRRMKNPKR